MPYRQYNDLQKLSGAPNEVKKKYENTTRYGQRHDTDKGKEHAKGRNIGD